MTVHTRVKHLVGTADNIIYYKPKDSQIPDQPPKVKAVQNDRTQENMHDFSRACTGAKLIRRALANIFSEIKDLYHAGRLNKEMHKVVKSDKLNPRGFRKITDGNIELVQGFEVNTERPFATVFQAPFVAEINRATGIMRVDFPSLITDSLIERPEGARYFRLSIAGASIDFNTDEHLVQQKEGEFLKIDCEGVLASSLEVQLPPGGNSALILALGISLYHKAKGKFHAIGHGMYNAAAFVKVSGS